MRGLATGANASGLEFRSRGSLVTFVDWQKNSSSASSTDALGGRRRGTLSGAFGIFSEASVLSRAVSGYSVQVRGV